MGTISCPPAVYIFSYSSKCLREWHFSAVLKCVQPINLFCLILIVSLSVKKLTFSRQFPVSHGNCGKWGREEERGCGREGVAERLIEPELWRTSGTFAFLYPVTQKYLFQQQRPV